MIDFTDDELETIELACDIMIDTDWAWRYSGAASGVKDKIDQIRKERAPDGT